MLGMGRKVLSMRREPLFDAAKMRKETQAILDSIHALKSLCHPLSRIHKEYTDAEEALDKTIVMLIRAEELCRNSVRVGF
jgi:hypothetical protein